MPNVVGQQFQTAESMVRERQPNARISSTPSPRYNPDFRPGAVIYQSLKEGTELKPGIEITLVYNPPQSRVNYPKMPNVIGQQFQTAESMVRERQPRTRINSTPSLRFNPDFKPFAVINQSLKESADLQPGVEVTLVYNPQQPAPAYPRMPDLVGMDIRSAQAKLSGEAPNYPQRSIEESEFNPRFKPGVVVNQSPRAGMALQPRGVAVMYYNPQQPKVIVPDVMGLTVPEAVGRIEQNNLVARLPRRGNLDSYRITGQSPSAGTVVEARSGVTLTVAATVVVPDLRRSLLGEAQQTISQNRLTVGSVTTRISSVRQDEVISQSPEPNSVVVEGTAVNLVVARTEQVPVPNVLNSQQGNAEQLIANAKLGVGQVTKRESPRAAGTVLDQSPRAGTMVNIGSQVSLVIAMPETVVVPDLQNKAQGTAEQLIANARLGVGQVTTQQTTVAAGTVLSQTPSAGTLVNVGTQVSFVVAVPTTTASPTPTQTPTPTPTVTPTLSPVVTPTPLLFVVPDLRNKELTEAVLLVRKTQLEVGEINREDPKETASFVLKQQPEAGQLVAAGTRVNLVIGKKADGGILKEWPKALAVGAFGFAALLAARLWKRFRPKPDPPPAPTLSFRTTMNANSVEFAASTDLQTSFALRFQPKADWGQQYITLTGGLVAAESEER